MKSKFKMALLFLFIIGVGQSNASENGRYKGRFWDETSTSALVSLPSISQMLGEINETEKRAVEEKQATAWENDLFKLQGANRRWIQGVLLEGQLLIENRAYEMAINHYGKANRMLDDKSQKLECLLAVGYCQYKSQYYNEAIDTLLAVLKLDDCHGMIRSDCWSLISWCQAWRGDASNAALAWEQSLHFFHPSSALGKYYEWLHKLIRNHPRG